MNISDTECGSGCESGWTSYLDQSSYSNSRWQSYSGIVDEDYVGKGARLEYKREDEEEDLSMVSDASSGPRHYYEDYEEIGNYFPAPSASDAKGSKSKKKVKENQHHSYLEDTASSPILSFSKKNLRKEASVDVFDPSQDNSGNNKRKSGIRKNFGFLQTSFSGKPAPREAGSFQGSKCK